MKPIINWLLGLIGKGLIQLPHVDDEKFDKIINRIGKISEATAPTVAAIAEGLGRSGMKSLEDKIND